VHGGELGAIRHVGVARGAQVTDVVEQGDDDAEHGALGPELLGVGHLHVMPGDEPRGGERDVEGVLLIVIDGVDTVIPRHAAGEHAVEIAEHLRERRKALAGPDFGEQLFDCGPHVGSRAHEYRVGHVVVASAGFCAHFSAMCSGTNKMGESRQQGAKKPADGSRV
jgi:hypothetical protein